jgi:hypothetical protein
VRKAILLGAFFMTFHGFTSGGRAIKHTFKDMTICNQARESAVRAMRAQTFFKADELVSPCIPE